MKILMATISLKNRQRAEMQQISARSLCQGGQEAPHALVIHQSPDQPAEEGPDDGHPKNRTPAGKAVIFESGDNGQQARAEIAGGIDRVAVHAPEGHTDCHNNQADDERSQVRRANIRRGHRISGIDDGENESDQKSRAQNLIEQAGRKNLRKRRESGEHSRRVVEQGIGAMKSQTVVLIHNGGSGERPSGLGKAVGHNFAPGEIPEDGERQSDSGVQMGSRNPACHINAHSDSQSPAQSDIGVPAVDNLAGDAGAEQRDHGDDAGAEKDQDHRAEKLGNQFASQASRFHAVPLRRSRSRATAATIMHPVNTSLTQFGTPFMLSPLRMTVISNAPARDPRTLPCPPERLPPPMTTAAMMSSSIPLAAVGSPTVSRLNCIRPAKPVSNPPSV